MKHKIKQKMKLKQWLFASILALLGTSVFAQFDGFDVEEVDNGNFAKGKTYRLYVVLKNDSDQVNMVFGNEQHPMEIKSSKPFFQSEYGAPLSNGINRKMAREKAEVRYDSWLTIGAEDNYDNATTNFLLNLDEFEKTGAAIKSADGAWFVTPGNKQALALKGKRVLISQLTTQGEISGKVSIMGRNSKGEVFYEYDVPIAITK
jgi:hypothetical protein